MKKTIILTIIISVVLFCSSCCQTGSCRTTKNGINNQKFTLCVTNGISGWNADRSFFQCDSFSMANEKECVFWSNGVKSILKSNNSIQPNSN